MLGELVHFSCAVKQNKKGKKKKKCNFTILVNTVYINMWILMQWEKDISKYSFYDFT